MKKLILVESEDDCGGCYDCGGGGYSEPMISQFDSLSEIVARLANEIANDHNSMEILVKNDLLRKALDDRGFRDVAKVKDATEKAKLESRFYISDKIAGYRGGSFHTSEVDIANMSQYDAEKLAKKDTELLQVVSKTSLRTAAPTAYKHMNAAKKRIAAQQAGKKKKAAERAAKKKQKEIEAAKKLLEQEGITQKES